MCGDKIKIDTTSINRGGKAPYVLLFLIFAGALACFFFEWGRFAVLFGGLLVVAHFFMREQGRKLGLSSDEGKWLLYLFWGALLIRIMVMLIFHIYTVAQGKDGFYFFDDKSYHTDVVESLGVLESGKDFEITDIISTTEGFHIGFKVFVLVIYFLAGKFPLFIKFMNTLAGAMSVVFLYLITRKIFNCRTARIAAVIAAIDAVSIYWGSFMLKDVFLTFLCMSLLYFMTAPESISSRRWLYLPVMAVTFVFLLFTRIYSGAALFVAGIVGFLAQHVPRRSDRRVIYTVVTLIIVLGVAGGLGYLAYHFGFFDLKIVVRENAQGVMEATTPKEAVLSFFSKEGLTSTLLLFYGPFVWLPLPEGQADELIYVIYPFMWLWYFLAPFALLGFLYTAVYKLRESAGLIVFAIIGALSLVFLIYSPNRQKIFLLPTFYFFAGVGINYFRNKAIVYVLYIPLIVAFIFFQQGLLDLLRPMLALNVAGTLLCCAYIWLDERKKRASALNTGG